MCRSLAGLGRKSSRRTKPYMGPSIDLIGFIEHVVARRTCCILPSKQGNINLPDCATILLQKKNSKQCLDKKLKLLNLSSPKRRANSNKADWP